MWKWCSIESKKMYGWAYKLKVNGRKSSNLEMISLGKNQNSFPRFQNYCVKMLVRIHGKSSGNLKWVITAKVGHPTFYLLVTKTNMGIMGTEEWNT